MTDLSKFFDESEIDFEAALIEVERKVENQQVIEDDDADCDGCKI